MPDYYLDFETDPFEYGLVPEPFAVCVLGDEQSFNFWGSSREVIKKTAKFLSGLDGATVYAHNGGKFDFHYLLDFARGDLTIINGRVAVMQIGGAKLVDSYLLMPVALSAYQKTEIDYKKFRRENREKHREEITRYLLDDCRNLRDLVIGFKGVVGDCLTIGQAAFKQLRETNYKISRGTERHDEKFRKYYAGGRCQAFKKGVFEGEFHYCDINSAYPWAMLARHPTGEIYDYSSKLPKTSGPWFACVEAISRGALWIRTKTGLEYPEDNDVRVYYATGHEIIAGLETDTLKIKKVHDVYVPRVTQNFSDYVNKFYELRNAAKADGDKLHTLVYKLLLNSGYGKFCTDPRKFADYTLCEYDNHPGDGWEHVGDCGDVSLFKKSAYKGYGFYNVATGASITGQVRAELWRAICNTIDVHYCDTDSIMCTNPTGLKFGDKLGEWKLEMIGHELCIAGKKLYGIKSTKDCKTASKGVNLNYSEIRKVAKGETITARRDAPNFRIGKTARFIERSIKST